MEDEPQEGELAPLVQSPEFSRMVDRFQASTGLRLQVFDMQARPLTPVEEYPRYCRILQERKVCPLYFDNTYLKRDQETMANCHAGIGHFLAPIRDEKQQQTGAVLSPAVKYAPNDVEPLAELAFQLKVFPDELIQAAEAVQEREAEKLLGAGELVAVGLNLLAEMQAKERVARALRRLEEQVAESNSEMLSQHMVETVIYLTRADYALVLLMDDSGSDLASAFDQPHPDHLVEAKRRLLEGIAEWVKHADRTVTVPDIGKSAWCRYLTNEAVNTGSLVGLPISMKAASSTYGAIVVGYDLPRDDLEEPLSALNEFVTEGLYAIMMGRKLIQAEQSAARDTQSGAYSRRYLEDLLDREVSRASRFNNNLAIALFEIDAYEVLRGKYGEAGLGRILRELVALVTAKTRKVNSFCRVQDGKFCLLIPQADREVAVRLGERIRQSLEEHPFAASAGGEILRLSVNVGVAVSENGKEDRAALFRAAEESLAEARTERRISSFKP
jgi:diguanylate cyclase (GGDEF)-like protein